MKKLMIAGIMTLTSTALTAQSLTYPTTRKDGTVDEYFGQKVADPGWKMTRAQRPPSGWKHRTQ